MVFIFILGFVYNKYIVFVLHTIK